MTFESNETKNPVILGVSGFIGAGKDSAADYLVNVRQYRRESFASSLKDAVAAVFGWDKSLLEGRTRQSREWREQVDAWWSTRLGIPNLTPRWVLQHWGTEVLRQGFNNDIWVASLENKLRKVTDDVVITDCRFHNEMETIRKVGGQVIWIHRGPLPDWYEIAALANQGDPESQARIKELGVHASEYSWVGSKFDFILENNSTLDSLYDSIEDILKTIHKQRS